VNIDEIFKFVQGKPYTHVFFFNDESWELSDAIANLFPQACERLSVDQSESHSVFVEFGETGEHLREALRVSFPLLRIFVRT
jgi:hypothetical protein